MGFSFIPEVSHTPYGSLILGNFLDRICGNPRTWTMEAFIERILAEVNRRVGPDERVVCGLSGGVDSAVCAALLAKSLGPPGRLRVRRYGLACGSVSGRRSRWRSARARVPSSA